MPPIVMAPSCCQAASVKVEYQCVPILSLGLLVFLPRLHHLHIYHECTLTTSVLTFQTSITSTHLSPEKSLYGTATNLKMLSRRYN